LCASLIDRFLVICTYPFFMPVVTITMAKGRNYEQKKRMAEEIAGTVTCVLGVPPERVTILIHELEQENIAIAGTLLSEQQK